MEKMLEKYLAYVSSVSRYRFLLEFTSFLPLFSVRIAYYIYICFSPVSILFSSSVSYSLAFYILSSIELCVCGAHTLTQIPYIFICCLNAVGCCATHENLTWFLVRTFSFSLCVDFDRNIRILCVTRKPVLSAQQKKKQ